MKLFFNTFFFKYLLTIIIFQLPNVLNGQILSETEVEYLIADFDSTIIKEGISIEDKRHGIWTFKKEKTVGTFLYLEGEYVNGKRTGLWETFYQNGKN